MVPTDGEGLLKNPIRAEIVSIVCAEPGLSYLVLLDRLRGRTGLATTGHGTLTWHLYKLERAGLVSSVRSGRCRRFFPEAGPWHADLAAFASLQGPRQLALARCIAEAPGIDGPRLQERMGDPVPASRQVLAYHIRYLVRHGFVVPSRSGRAKAYVPTPRLVAVLQRMDAVEEGPMSWSVAGAGREWTEFPRGAVLGAVPGAHV